MVTNEETASETEQQTPVHPILAILFSFQTELDEQGERYDTFKYRSYVPHQTKERALYALDAQMRLLQQIIEKVTSACADLEVHQVAAEESLRHFKLENERLCKERDARVVSPEMLHDAFRHAVSEHSLFPLTDKEQAMYVKMAEYVNNALVLRAACSEPGYVWSNEECDE